METRTNFPAQAPAAAPSPWLAAFVAAALFWAAGGRLYNLDSRIYYAQAEALWLRGALELKPPPGTADDPGFWVRDRWGIARGRFPIGTAAALGPGVLLGAAAQAAVGRDRTEPVNEWRTQSEPASVLVMVAWLCFLNGLGCWMLAHALHEAGFSARTAVLAALLVFLGEAGVWRVARTVWAENVSLCALSGVVWLWVRQSPGRTPAIGSGRREWRFGLALGALPWIQPALTPPAICLALAAGFEHLHRKAAPWRLWLGTAATAAALLGLNTLLFGAPLSGGYLREGPMWACPLETGDDVLFALLTWHWPVLLGALGAAWLPARRDGWCSAVMLAGLAAHVSLFFFRKPEMLDRLLTPAAVLAAPGLAAMLEALNRPSRRWVEQAVCGLVLAAMARALLAGDSLTLSFQLGAALVKAPNFWWLRWGVAGGAGGAAFLFAGALMLALIFYFGRRLQRTMSRLDAQAVAGDAGASASTDTSPPPAVPPSPPAA